MRQTGILSGAVAEAEVLVRDEPSPANVLLLIQACQDMGDLNAAAVASRRLLSVPDVPADQFIGVIHIVALVDPNLANALWDRLVKQPEALSDELVGPVISLGTKLGRDDDMRRIMARLDLLAQNGRGGVLYLNMREVKHMMQQQQRASETFDASYRQAAAPLHIIAELQKWPLPILFHGQLVANQIDPDPLRQFALLARHGSRPLAPVSEPRQPLNMVLDTSAVLLAAHLDILELVEQTFGPLSVPADLVSSLVTMQSELMPHQPTQVLVAKEVLNLVDTGKLSVLKTDFRMSEVVVPALGSSWNTLFAQVRCAESFLIDYLPKHSLEDLETPVTLPEHVAPFMLPVRALIESLNRHGHFSGAEYLRTLERLGNDQLVPVSADVLPLGARVVLAGNVPETLARAGVLGHIARHFVVSITENEVQRVRSVVQGDADRQALLQWLRRLVEQLRQKIEYQRLKVLPFPVQKWRREEDEEPLSLVDRSLFTLFLYQSGEHDVLWIDDRTITSSLHRDGVPIVTITDVLQWLRAREAISEAEYYDKLLTLRAANFRFVPLDTEEVLFHLQHAPVDEHNIVETRPLQILRRYAAACVWRNDLLLKPSADTDGIPQAGELTFLLHSRRAVVHAVWQAWSSSSDPDTRQARAVWIYSNMYLPSIAVRDFIAPVTNIEEQRILLSLDLAELLAMATLVSPDEHPDVASEQAFNIWVVDQLVVPRCKADPLLPAAIAERLKLSLNAVYAEAASDPERTFAVMQAQALYQSLPPSIQAHLEDDNEFMGQIGYRLELAIKVKNYAFNRSAFVDAVSAAMAGRKVVLSTTAGEDRFSVRQCDADTERGSVCIEHVHSREVIPLDDPEFLLVNESIAEREAVLRRHQFWFERPTETVDQVIATIAAIDDPVRRLEAASAWRVRSITLFYETLHWRLQTGQPVTFAQLLPPQLDECLWYLCIDPQHMSAQTVETMLAAGASQLIVEFGLATTIQRLSSLPAPLPEIVRTTLTRLDPPEQRKTVKALLGSCRSPLSIFHLLHICCLIPNASPGIPRLARVIMHKLLTQLSEGNLQRFIGVVRWVDGAIGRQRSVRTWPSAQRIYVVWSHAHHLWDVFNHAGVSPEQLSKWLSEFDDGVSPELFEPDESYKADPANPMQGDDVSLVLDGLAYSLEEAGESILTPELRELLTSIAYSGGIDDRPFPRLSLLEFSTTGPTCVPSFLGGDRGTTLRPLLIEGAADVLARDALRTDMSKACARLAETPHDMISWAVLYTLLSDRRPEAALAEQVAELFQQLNFVDLIRKDADAGLFALQVAAQQGQHLPADSQQQLIGVLVPVTELLAQLTFPSSRQIDISTLR